MPSRPRGPLAFAARRWCRRRNRPFTTSYHTQFPEYVRARAPVALALWSRGVDTALFRPQPKGRRAELPRPPWLYFGRVAVEKGIEDFLELDLSGTKMVVGSGPAEAELRARYPHAVFTGARYGEALAALVADADVFVFPSRTDTFGLVLLESMACGVPVAAIP